MPTIREKIVRLYNSFNIPWRKYILFYVLPVMFLTIFLAIFILSFYHITLYPLRLVIYLIPAFGVLFSVLFPLIRGERKKTEIEKYMHLFITRMAVLASTQLPRKEIFRILSEVKEYGALSDEIEKIYHLVEYWNMSLPDAARVVAKRCPSMMLADFLDRLAHSAEAGEDFEKFLEKERKVVLETYAIKYEAAMAQLDVYKEAFVAILISMLFFAVFAAILPMFMNIDSTILLYMILLAFGFVEGIMLYAIKVRLPEDDIWHKRKDVRSPQEIKLLKILPFTYLAVALLFIITTLLHISVFLVVAISILPLFYPGYLIHSAESDLINCDENYDAFIRAVGSYVEAKGSDVMAMERLRKHDFGKLTKFIDTLYKRLLTRIDKKKAWQYFAGETGSNLISKFTDMYVTGIEMGGVPSTVSRIISDAYIRMIGLRKKRYQSATNLTGVLYGLMVGMAFTLYTTLSLMRMMANMIKYYPVNLSQYIKIPLLSAKFPIEVANVVFLTLLVIHAFVSALMIKVVSGSHKHSLYLHFSMLSWIGILVAYITNQIVGKVLGF
ncbi:MAG: archaellar assembly protein FlaJ [Euryarchaeota archaeon]|nr:archaellar assembly protein FlaJ [Euryarchaeota archaeon]